MNRCQRTGKLYRIRQALVALSTAKDPEAEASKVLKDIIATTAPTRWGSGKHRRLRKVAAGL